LDLFIWLLRVLLLGLDASVASSCHPVDLNGSRIILALVGTFHFAASAHDVFLLIVHLIVNFFIVVIETFINVLLLVIFFDTNSCSLQRMKIRILYVLVDWGLLRSVPLARSILHFPSL
jgi:hypothetical protein